MAAELLSFMVQSIPQIIARVVYILEVFAVLVSRMRSYVMKGLVIMARLLVFFVIRSRSSISCSVRPLRRGSSVRYRRRWHRLARVASSKLVRGNVNPNASKSANETKVAK